MSVNFYLKGFKDFSNEAISFFKNNYLKWIEEDNHNVCLYLEIR